MISFIIPIYNVEKYFKEKIDLISLKKSRVILYTLVKIFPSLLIMFTISLVKRNEHKRMRIINAAKEILTLNLENILSVFKLHQLKEVI